MACKEGRIKAGLGGHSYKGVRNFHVIDPFFDIFRSCWFSILSILLTLLSAKKNGLSHLVYFVTKISHLTVLKHNFSHWFSIQLTPFSWFLDHYKALDLTPFWWSTRLDLTVSISRSHARPPYWKFAEVPSPPGSPAKWQFAVKYHVWSMIITVIWIQSAGILHWCIRPGGNDHQGLLTWCNTVLLEIFAATSFHWFALSLLSSFQTLKFSPICE